MPARRIAVIVGSLRREAFSRRVANALRLLQPASINLEIVEIAALPLYNQDDEAQPPQAWVDFRDRIRSSDAVLFVTPEYNRSIPGGLKNAIDVGSRPFGKSAWEGKPCAIVSCTPGGLGGMGANFALRQALIFLDMPVLQQPEMYLSRVDTLIDAQGNVSNDKTRELLDKFLHAYCNWIERNMRAA